jgi:hypothetical protein
MADPVESSPQWRADAVLKRLQESASKGQPVSAQVFMSGSVSPDDIARKAQEIVNKAADEAGVSRDAVRVGKIFPLAKSFSVTSDKPDIFRSIVNSNEVNSILESEQSDILPKPVNRRPDP